jgi:hypothetical protein
MGVKKANVFNAKLMNINTFCLHIPFIEVPDFDKFRNNITQTTGSERQLTKFKFPSSTDVLCHLRTLRLNTIQLPKDITFVC